MKGEPLRRMRRRMQMIFEDPYGSLHPRITVGDIVGEPPDVPNIVESKERREPVEELLEIVCVNPYFVNR